MRPSLSARLRAYVDEMHRPDPVADLPVLLGNWSSFPVPNYASWLNIAKIELACWAASV